MKVEGQALDEVGLPANLLPRIRDGGSAIYFLGRLPPR
jgi:hypothetical protein